MQNDFTELCEAYIETDEELLREARWVEERGQYIELPPPRPDAWEKIMQKIEEEQEE